MNEQQRQDGAWVPAKPLPFYYGVLTKSYWRNFAKLVGQALRGEDREL